MTSYLNYKNSYGTEEQMNKSAQELILVEAGVFSKGFITVIQSTFICFIFSIKMLFTTSDESRY